MKPEKCILCYSPEIELFYRDTSEHYESDYYRCGHCELIFAPKKDLPNAEEEYERYETHENDPSDEDYRTFLGRLFKPMESLLEPESRGLDFGSGPGPTLHIMFEEAGHEMEIYDPFYADDPTVFDGDYDFITLTEVAEHLHEPRKEFERLWSCLKPGGYLGIMTALAGEKKDFANWHYRLDETHVTFYTRKTFRWLAGHWNAGLSFYPENVVIIQKPRGDNE